MQSQISLLGHPRNPKFADNSSLLTSSLIDVYWLNHMELKPHPVGQTLSALSPILLALAL